MYIIHTSRIDTTVKLGVDKRLASARELVGGIKRHTTQGRAPPWLGYAPLIREQYVESLLCSAA